MVHLAYRASVLMLALACMCVTLRAQEEKPLDNAEIVKLTKLDMGDAVIIAKIKAAKQVKFETSSDDLVKLKDMGVSKPVLAAMVERQAAGADSSSRPAESAKEVKVTLRTASGSISLNGIYGTAKTKMSWGTMQSWIQFIDLSAKIRIKDRRPAILIAADKDPRGRWWFVKTSQQKGEDYRYFDLEGGGYLSQQWSGTPEEGSIVKCEATEEKPGLWALTPVKDLKPGEYGVYSGQLSAFAGLAPTMEGQTVLFDFGVDK